MTMPAAISEIVPLTTPAEPCEYLVGYGKSGAFGRFLGAGHLDLQRGDRVVVESARGVEIGVVLCPATAQHGRLLASSAPGRLLRRAAANDQHLEEDRAATAQALFDDARRLVSQAKLPVEVLDAEVLLDGRQAIIQVVSPPECDPTSLVEQLAQVHALELRLENLALPAPRTEKGCDKPDCGRVNGTGCTSCGSSGGGCASCGSGGVDLRAYFAHLRSQIDERQRTPLL
jgi:cell fate regulator YaaT (PSP1 superfamily)